LLFYESRHGGVVFGEVMAVDAKGSRAPGVMRYEAGQLDIVVPGAFADRAALPLIVDPLITGVFSTGFLPGGTTGGAAGHHHRRNDVFLVAWSEIPNSVSSPRPCFGRLVTPDGQLRGPLLCLACGPTLENASICSITSIGAHDEFVVWIR